jgi:tripartite motif-containing protein 9/67
MILDFDLDLNLVVTAPGQPTILPEDCSAENNSVTIAWQPYPGSVVDAYTLELDDGNGGDFRVRIKY